MEQLLLYYALKVTTASKVMRKESLFIVSLDHRYLMSTYYVQGTGGRETSKTANICAPPGSYASLWPLVCTMRALRTWLHFLSHLFTLYFCPNCLMACAILQNAYNVLSAEQTHKRKIS